MSDVNAMEGKILVKLSNELAEVVTKIGQSVIAVNGRRAASGSGIIWSADGVVVTADHIIEDEEGISVTFPDGQVVPATFVGRDPGTDLAVLRVQHTNLAPAEQAPAGSTRLGNLVLAVGRSGGTRLTTTLGIVSALSGPWRTWRGGLVESLIQSDVALFPGFSGGPLVDANGRVIGLNSSIFIRGVGAAVPVETIQQVVRTILAQGRVRRGYLGVSTQSVPLPTQLIQRLSLSQDRGLLLTKVEPGSPAEKGGLMLGDVLLTFAGQSVQSGDELQGLLGPDRVGAETPVRLIRGGELKEAAVKVGERP